MTNLLEPWVLVRLAAGVVAFALFARAAVTAQRVLRYFDVRRATEGQLALEKRVELAATFARVAAVVQVAALALTALSADRLSRGVRGAMCAYGVFAAHEWGFRALAITGGVALAAGIVTQLYAFDARVRTLDLARPLAIATCVMAPLSAVDLLATGKFLLGLDLSVVASCCSVQLDPVAATGETFATGPRVLLTAIACGGTVLSIAAALLAARAPSRRAVLAAGALSVVTLPAALAASVLEVAPHAFEVPSHVCPFCLLRMDVFALGYPLYGALFLATAWGGGAAVSALLARGGAATTALGAFASRRLRLGAAAWACALALGAFPVVRFAVVGNGASLFP
ncbi:MAG: hypothetical protein KIT84_05505 [Labilithrix sp.]|nr:hypothetical protein [Labilithrix sp.]MCW5810444.1 hypothetical protein [Labilithrix sp.]